MLLVRIRGRVAKPFRGVACISRKLETLHAARSRLVSLGNCGLGRRVVRGLQVEILEVDLRVRLFAMLIAGSASVISKKTMTTARHWALPQTGGGTKGREEPWPHDD